jgi:hypothetical protein
MFEIALLADAAEAFNKFDKAVQAQNKASMAWLVSRRKYNG